MEVNDFDGDAGHPAQYALVGFYLCISCSLLDRSRILCFFAVSSCVILASPWFMSPLCAQKSSALAMSGQTLSSPW